MAAMSTTLARAAVLGGALALVASVGAAPAHAATAGPGCDASRAGVVDHHAGARPASRRAHRALVRCVMKPGFKLTESNLVVDPDGTVFVGMTASGGTDVIASRNDGRTWARAGRTGQDSAGMGWLDRDPASGRLFASSLFVSAAGGGPCTLDNAVPTPSRITSINPHTVFSDAFSYSDDHGRTWKTSKDQLCNGGDWGKTFLGPAATPADRATLARRGLRNVIYHCMGATIEVTRTCWRSLDDGVTFSRLPGSAASQFPTLGTTRLSGECAGDPAQLPGASPFNFPDPHFLMGNGVVAPDGTILIPGNACGRIIVAISRDDGETWTARPIPVAKGRGWYPHDGIDGYVVPTNGGLPGVRPQQTFKHVYGEAAMSALYSQQFGMDRDGRIYFTWVDPRGDKPMLSVSTDQAASWTKPVMIAPAGVRYAATSAIAVDKPGRVAIAYFGTRDGATYDGFLTTTDQALKPDPEFQSMQVSPHDVLQPNGVAEPTEYLGVGFDPHGTPWASYPRDTCRIDPASPATQCDSELTYTNERFDGVVARLADPALTGCLNGRAGARGKRLGPGVLGRTRRRQRKAFRGKRLHTRRGMDRYCASPAGSYRIGYATRRLERTLSHATRRRIHGRAVLILTSSRRYRVHGIAPGTSVKRLRRALRGERRIRVGRNVWYLTRTRRVACVYKTRGGRVTAVGVADRRLAGGRDRQRRLLRAWQL
jgi:hypothetical protein